MVDALEDAHATVADQPIDDKVAPTVVRSVQLSSSLLPRPMEFVTRRVQHKASPTGM